MARETSDKAGSTLQWPWIAIALAALLAGGAGWMHTSSREAAAHFDERQAEVRQFFDEHLYLTRDAALDQLLEGSQFERQRLHVEGYKGSGRGYISAARMQREQSRLENLVSDAVAARALLPTGRYGVSSIGGPPIRLFTHAAAHQTGIAICITLIVLLAAGVALETAWGHLIFALFCAGSIAGVALLRVSGAPPLQLPWAGSSGLAAALIGAYMALTLRGIARHYGGLLSGWLLAPLWLASQYVLLDAFWQPSFDHSLTFIHSVAAAVGFAVATLVSALGLERQRDGSAKKKPSEAARVMGKARRARASGQEAHAFALLRAEAERTAANSEIVSALWELAQELGQELAAAPAVLDLAKRALLEGRPEDAVKLWLDLVAARVSPSAEPLILVCMGEALLDEGHATEALAAMASALEVDDPIPSALALRIVKVARDLDPKLTLVSAKLALADPRLHPKERNDLKALVSAAGSASGEAPVEQVGAVAQTAPDVESPSPKDFSSNSDGLLNVEGLANAQLEEDSADIESLDPDALSAESLAEFFDADDEAAGVDADQIASWNDPGLVEDLSDGIPDQEIEEDSTDTLALDLAPGDISDPMAEAQSQDAIDTAVDLEPSGCKLRVVKVIPIALNDSGLVLDVEGQGKTCLRYDRIEAVAVAAVEGLSEKPVIVVDLVLNWMSFSGESMRVLRIRCDSFDPRRVVSGDSPLESLTGMLDALLTRTGAAHLPDAHAARGNPFSRFGSLAEYEAEVLRADSSLA